MKQLTLGPLLYLIGGSLMIQLITRGMTLLYPFLFYTSISTMIYLIIGNVGKNQAKVISVASIIIVAFCYIKAFELISILEEGASLQEAMTDRALKLC
jgi:hypothetical protein